LSRSIEASRAVFLIWQVSARLGCRAIGITWIKKNRTLAGPAQFVGAGADFHLPEGNSYRQFDCDLGGWATVADSERSQYAGAGESNNTASRMPAMRVLRAGKFMLRICAGHAVECASCAALRAKRRDAALRAGHD
jgi:hypothetical protein